MADRRVGDDGDDRPQAPGLVRGGFGLRQQRDLAVEDEDQVRQVARTRRPRRRGPLSGWSSSGVFTQTLPIGWRPAHRSLPAVTREQMLNRWRWSIWKALGRVTVTDFRFASPSRVRRSNWSRGFWERWSDGRHWRTVIVGLNPRSAQLTAWK